MHVIDWAASPDAPGAGVAVYLETIRKARTLFGIGGSDMGRKVVRALGISEAGELRIWIRVLRPWEQYRRRHKGPQWKRAAKLARACLWNVTAPRRTSWNAVPVTVFPDSLDAILSALPEWPCTTFERDTRLLNYILACPIDSCRGFLLFEAKTLRGYFILSRTGPLVRIADLWISGGGAEAWRQAYTAAAISAMDDPEAIELRAFSSTPFVEAALAGSGFHPATAAPLWLADPRHLLQNAPPLHVQPIESDALFLYDSSEPFLG
jgi:hypothetical protein